MTFLHQKILILLGAGGISLSLATPIQAETFNGNVTGNVTGTSTYVWRGQRISVDAALQGAINYQDPEGIHAGFWTSNAGGLGSEVDLIVGYAGKTSGIDYDAGVVFYQYPNVNGENFEEVYLGITQGALAAKFSTSSDIGSYFEVAGTFPVKSWNMTAHFGHYSLKSDTNKEDYADYNVSFTKSLTDFDVSFMIGDTDMKDDDYRTVASVSKDFQP